MNQPLTIEQLKNLNEYEYVYLTNADRMYGTYARKLSKSDDEGFAFETIDTYEKYKYSEYGLDWYAFSNKQEADTKCDEEVIKFPCIRVINGEYRVYFLNYKHGNGDIDYIACLDETDANEQLAEFTNKIN